MDVSTFSLFFFQICGAGKIYSVIELCEAIPDFANRFMMHQNANQIEPGLRL